MKRLGAQLGLKADVFKYEPSTELVLPKCRVGAEFEFERVRAEPPLDQEWYGYWEMKRDGSLHDNGMEFTFDRPLFGQDVISAITGLCEWATKKKFAISKRTGLHIHVDVRDLTLVELARLNVLYALFEKLVYRFVGNDRDDNVFCLPWYAADKVPLTVNHILNSDKGELKSKAAQLAEEKYAGLNLDSLARFGSVEFRHALTTTDTTWVIRWINVCLSFKKAAVELTEEPLDLLHRLSRNGVDILAREIFGPLYPYVWYAELDHDVWTSGIETALAVCPQAVIERKLDRNNLSWFTEQEKTKVEVNPAFIARMEDRGAKKAQPLGQQADRRPNLEVHDQLGLTIRSPQFRFHGAQRQERQRPVDVALAPEQQPAQQSGNVVRPPNVIIDEFLSDWSFDDDVIVDDDNADDDEPIQLS